MQWSFGMTKGVPVINLTDEHRKMVAYACAHTAVLYDFANNKQYLLEGHVSDVSRIHLNEIEAILLFIVSNISVQPAELHGNQ